MSIKKTIVFSFLLSLTFKSFAVLPLIQPKYLMANKCKYIRTERILDLVILNKDYFVVKRGKGDKLYFVRTGNFNVDRYGYIIDSEGNYVQGINKEGDATLHNIKIPQDIQYLDITPDGEVLILKFFEWSYLDSIVIAKFKKPRKLTQITPILFSSNRASGSPSIAIKNAYGAILPHYLEAYPCL